MHVAAAKAFFLCCSFNTLLLKCSCRSDSDVSTHGYQLAYFYLKLVNYCIPRMSDLQIFLKYCSTLLNYGSTCLLHYSALPVDHILPRRENYIFPRRETVDCLLQDSNFQYSNYVLWRSNSVFITLRPELTLLADMGSILLQPTITFPSISRWSYYLSAGNCRLPSAGLLKIVNTPAWAYTARCYLHPLSVTQEYTILDLVLQSQSQYLWT